MASSSSRAATPGQPRRAARLLATTHPPGTAAWNKGFTPKRSRAATTVRRARSHAQTAKSPSSCSKQDGPIEQNAWTTSAASLHVGRRLDGRVRAKRGRAGRLDHPAGRRRRPAHPERDANATRAVAPRAASADAAMRLTRGLAGPDANGSRSTSRRRRPQSIGVTPRPRRRRWLPCAERQRIIPRMLTPDLLEFHAFCLTNTGTRLAAVRGRARAGDSAGRHGARSRRRVRRPRRPGLPRGRAPGPCRGDQRRVGDGPGGGAGGAAGRSRHLLPRLVVRPAAGRARGRDGGRCARAVRLAGERALSRSRGRA